MMIAGLTDHTRIAHLVTEVYISIIFNRNNSLPPEE